MGTKRAEDLGHAHSASCPTKRSQKLPRLLAPKNHFFLHIRPQAKCPGGQAFQQDVHFARSGVTRAQVLSALRPIVYERDMDESISRSYTVGVTRAQVLSSRGPTVYERDMDEPISRSYTVGVSREQILISFRPLCTNVTWMSPYHVRTQWA